MFSLNTAIRVEYIGKLKVSILLQVYVKHIRCLLILRSATYSARRVELSEAMLRKISFNFCENIAKFSVLKHALGQISQSSICTREFQKVPQLSSMGHIQTVYSKPTIAIITKLHIWYHRVVHNIPAKFQSCRFHGLGGVALQRNTFFTIKSFASLTSIT